MSGSVMRFMCPFLTAVGAAHVILSVSPLQGKHVSNYGDQAFHPHSTDKTLSTACYYSPEEDRFHRAAREGPALQPLPSPCHISRGFEPRLYKMLRKPDWKVFRNMTFCRFTPSLLHCAGSSRTSCHYSGQSRHQSLAGFAELRSIPLPTVVTVPLCPKHHYRGGSAYSQGSERIQRCRKGLRETPSACLWASAALSTSKAVLVQVQEEVGWWWPLVRSVPSRRFSRAITQG